MILVHCLTYIAVNIISAVSNMLQKVSQIPVMKRLLTYKKIPDNEEGEEKWTRKAVKFLIKQLQKKSKDYSVRIKD